MFVRNKNDATYYETPQTLWDQLLRQNVISVMKECHFVVSPCWPISLSILHTHFGEWKPNQQVYEFFEHL